MEEKNVLKIKVSTVVLSILMIALVVALVVAVYQVTMLKQENTSKEAIISQLEKNTTSLQEEVSSLNETISAVRNTLTGTTTNTISNTTIKENNDVNTNTSTNANTNITSSKGKEENLGLITVTIPNEWIENGNYTINKSEDANRQDGVIAIYSFISNSNKASGGVFYRLAVVDKNISYDDIIMASIKTIVQNDKYKVIGGTATDVQWENNKDEFDYFTKYLDKLRESVKLN